MTGPGREHWRQIAQQEDIDDVRERILTGAGHGRPFTEHTIGVELQQPLSRVLDFGCGVGRNFELLSKQAEAIVGYDLDTMIDRCRTVPIPEHVTLNSEWQTIRTQKFDLVFSTLVLQHIDPEEVRLLLLDFAKMAPQFYLATRTRNDFVGSIIDLIVESERFEDAEWIVNDVPAGSPFKPGDRVRTADLVGIADETHVEALLTALAS